MKSHNFGETCNLIRAITSVPINYSLRICIHDYIALRIDIFNIELIPQQKRNLLILLPIFIQFGLGIKHYLFFVSLLFFTINFRKRNLSTGYLLT